jgi:hypothetical protein
MVKGIEPNLAARYMQLRSRLSQLPSVTRFDDGEHSEAETLAHAFIDLEGSFQKFLEEQLPKLFDADLTNEALHDLLLDMGEEFRHILYHLKDPRFYRYLEGR